MADPGIPPAPPSAPVDAGRRSVRPLVALLLVLAALVGVAVGPRLIGSPTASTAAGSPGAAGSSEPSLVATRPGPADGGSPAPTTPVLVGSAPQVGSIAAVLADGSLTLVAPDGGERGLTEPGSVSLAFPAWSPDGTEVATSVVAHGTTTIAVIRPGDAQPLPTVVYRNAEHGAFYLSWTPDGRQVSFLANDGDLVTLGIAAEAGAEPVTDVGPGSLIRRGAPLYFDWIDPDHLLLHVGTGPDAFLGEVGRDGIEVGATIDDPGGFRSAEVSADGRFVAWVRGGSDHGDVVVAGRPGGPQQTVPVFGLTAVSFDPVADQVASIGADAPGQPDVGFPVGPLRLVDAATGDVRTLLDGSVLAFFWSPDGRTIAALRLQPAGGASAAVPGAPFRLARAGGPLTAASPSAPPTEPHLVFVDVATGAVRSDRLVHPGSRFVSEYLPYFDQYGLSHRLWSADGSLFLLPIATAAGGTQVVALPPDGSASPFTLDADAAFWSP
jgi:hypothetical protein